LLTQDLEEVENRLINLAQKPVRERLAETLIILKETYGTKTENSSTLDIDLSREDLANIVGTATETVIRLLSDFKSEKLIATKGRKIEILNYNLLLKTSNVTD
jgi:CRP/FNR family transcriptional regulator